MRLSPDLVDRIERHLIDTGRTQQEFADAAGVHQPALSRALRGQRGFGSAAVERIVAELDRAEQTDRGDG